MITRIPWTERRFDFSFPSRLSRELISRVEGAPARARASVAGLDRGALTRRMGEGWSIQENIAHLADTDRDLFIPRLDQFEAGASELVAADMTNKATWAADHNERTIEDVLGQFEAQRRAIVARLDAHDEAFFERSALHPRLGTPMRVADMLLFQAEHDDYHLARVRELSRAWEAA
jgi:hypothetical protein